MDSATNTLKKLSTILCLSVICILLSTVLWGGLINLVATTPQTSLFTFKLQFALLIISLLSLIISSQAFRLTTLVGCLFLSLIALLAFAFNGEFYWRPLILLFLFVPLIQFCQLTIRILRSDNLIISFLGLELILLLVVGVEFYRQVRAPVALITGDWNKNVFQYYFPANPPFFNEGGRFKKNANYRLVKDRCDVDGKQFITNSVGFRNQDISPGSEPSKILQLGDSMANGFGLGQNDFFGMQLQKQLRKSKQFDKAIVLNAEISDPAYALYYYNKYGKKLKPQIVLLSIFPGNDFLQAYARSGFKESLMQFENAEIKYNPQHNDEFVRQQINKLMFSWQYKNSFKRKPPPQINRNYADCIVPFIKRFELTEQIDRLFIKESPLGQMAYFDDRAQELEGHKQLLTAGDALGFFSSEQNSIKALLIKHMDKVIRTFNTTLADDETKLALIYFPMRYQIQQRDWKTLKSSYNLEDQDFDLGALNKHYRELAKELGFSFIDPTSHLAEFGLNEQLFLPLDVHLNERGSQLMADYVARNLFKLLD